MYAIFDNLLNNNVKQFPDCSSVMELCNSFATFFNGKVANIRQNLDAKTVGDCEDLCNAYNEQCNTLLSKFHNVSVDDVSKVILSLPNKSCMLDTLPMPMFKDNVDVLAEPLTKIINESFNSGVFPAQLRTAVVTPILKKQNLDKQHLKNYRPVSNISYVSKIMEKLVCVQIKDHLASNDLQERYQSAYREQHSTETALLCVKTDLMRTMDEGNAAAVVLLDL